MEWNKKQNLTTLDCKSVSDLVSFVSRPDWLDRAAAYGSRSSHNTESSAEWDMNTGFNAALDMAKGNSIWGEGADKLGALTALAGQSIRGRIGAVAKAYKETGARPHIPRAVSGDPRSMVSIKKGAERSRPGLHIVINRALPSYVKAEASLYLSAAATAFAAVMDQRGYRVRGFYGKINMKQDGSGVCITAPLFSPESPLNMARLAFFGAHPASNRRIGFRAVEMGGEDTRGPGDSYGWNYRPNEADDQHKCLQDVRTSIGAGPSDKVVILPAPIQDKNEQGDEAPGYLLALDRVNELVEDMKHPQAIMQAALDAVIEAARFQGVEV